MNMESWSSMRRLLRSWKHPETISFPICESGAGTKCGDSSSSSHFLPGVSGVQTESTWTSQSNNSLTLTFTPEGSLACEQRAAGLWEETTRSLLRLQGHKRCFIYHLFISWQPRPLTPSAAARSFVAHDVTILLNTELPVLNLLLLYSIILYKNHV